jgi:uncharacterized membrane protein (UPF0127 family)
MSRVIYAESVHLLMTLTKSTLRFSALLLTACCAALPAWAQEGPQSKLPLAELTAGMHVIHAELAVTPEQQATGMMFRRGMGANDGMLFVNDDAGVRCFWMRNTLIPLSIAFLAEDGTIVNIADMAPRSDASHCSAKPVRYALEVPLGWFAKRGFKAGLKLRGGPFGK